MNESVNDPVVTAIRRLVELRDTEFKESQPFEWLRYKIAKAAMGMANLRDGGLIVIGVSQRDRLMATGVTAEHEATYDPDNVIEAINRHARPPVDCTVRVVNVDGANYVGIEVRTFDRSPIFCKRSTPDGTPDADKLIEGCVYARCNDRIGTTRVVDPDLMAEILEIAAERGAAKIVRVARQVGLQMPNDARDEILRRLDGILDRGVANHVIDVIQEFNRAPSARSAGAFAREREGFD